MSADARRAELLQAALRVMSRDGVAAGTTRAIVAEAGMPLATFHYCFRSRNELLRELITLVTTMERDAASAAMSADGDPPDGVPATNGVGVAAGDAPSRPIAPVPGDVGVGGGAGEDEFRETLRQGLRGYVGLLTENPGHELFLFELNHHALRTPELSDLAVAQYRRYYETATELLETAAALCGRRWTLDLPALSRLVVTVIDGATTTWLADRDTAATLAVLDLAADYVAGLAEPADSPGAGAAVAPGAVPSTRSV